MIWYPYQQMKTMKEPYHIVDAQGVYLYTREDKLIDSVSSWWSVIHGYKHPELNRAIQEQTERFAHVMLGGVAAGGPGLLLFLRLGQCGGGGGPENSPSVSHESGQQPQQGALPHPRLPRRYV